MCDFKLHLQFFFNTRIPYSRHLEKKMAAISWFQVANVLFLFYKIVPKDVSYQISCLHHKLKDFKIICLASSPSHLPDLHRYSSWFNISPSTFIQSVGNSTTRWVSATQQCSPLEVSLSIWLARP